MNLSDGLKLNVIPALALVLFTWKKINKMTCAPSALRSAWTSAQSDQFSLSARRSLSSLATHWVHSEDWSDWADTYVDLIFPWEPSHFVGFVMRWLNYGKHRSNQQTKNLRTYWRSDSVTRASGLRPGGCGFDPRPSHTKDFKNGISCSFVCAQHWESGTGRSGVIIMWLGGMSHHVPEVWYVSETAPLKWALSSLSRPDTVAIWLKDCWKRCYVWIN